VLKTKAPLGPPLALDQAVAPRGTKAAALGYPEDGGLRIAQAAVSASFDAVGRDIYGSGLVTRQIYEISAAILPGDSGGPMLGANGKVLGVVFSRSTVSPNVGYALTSSAVAGPITRGELSSAAVSTGACPSG
jgi:S1-C subfamily serine protease